MVKNERSKSGTSIKIKKKVLITQPKPESDKSPYFDLVRKYDVDLNFQPFIKLEAIPAKDFRKQKIINGNNTIPTILFIVNTINI